MQIIIIIIKSQAQSLNYMEFYLPKPIFCHEHLYVALSRVTSSKELRVLIFTKDDK